MIRRAIDRDASRIAEISVFSKRMNYREIFHDDMVSFGEIQVYPLAKEYIEHPEIHCIDGFLFKEDGNVLILQLADVFQAVQRVSGKSADGLGDNHVDVFGFAVANHPLPLYLR